MILDPQLARLAEWFAALQGRAGELLDQRLRGDCLGGLEQVALTLEQQIQPPLAPEEALVTLADDDNRHPLSRTRWRAVLEHEIRPAIHGARDTLTATAASFSEGMAAAGLLTDLARTVAEEPEIYFLERAAPDDGDDAPTEPEQIAVPLRRWLGEVFAEPVRGLVEELTRRAAALARDAAAELERIETVLDYHLFIVEDSREVDARDESAHTGLGHAIRLVRALSERTARGVRRLFEWFVAESSARMDDALAPLRTHRPDELLQQLEARAARSRASWLRAQRDRARLGALALYGRAAPVVRELAQDVRRTFTGEGPRVGYWDLLIAGENRAGSLPAIYRRLFGEVPLGLSDLYQHRLRLEAPCREVFQTWLAGQRVALLVTGDRGAGKRTLVNRVRAELHGELPVHWISMGPHLASEARLCAALCEATGAPYAGSFREFARTVPLIGGRRVLILENAEQLFVRTPEGLARMQAFLDLVRGTDEAILWVVLMAAPAATLLETCLRLPLYFGQVVHVPAESGRFIESMIRSRHRVSGFGLGFRERRAPALQRLRRPFTRADMLPDPGEEWFTDLERMCGGNLRQALDYWLLSARLDAKTQHDILVRPLPRRRGTALNDLSLPQRQVLVSLVQHGALTEGQLQEIVRTTAGGIGPEIDDLRRRHLVDQGGPGGFLTLRPTAVGPVTHDLRWRSMI
ncbi:ATP-binding protein [Nannocystis bainbridge]|uniref:ATP-binding protein n=1 Tax=Nannocystis bainbridge TaxID=2995303 RepID=A0ABT5DX12_9BACT|nr:ATP-binding protein [Nannocystis bainbridge]MDC0718163.1 ATP-binding protein [Nannocystis bainbridge]